MISQQQNDVITGPEDLEPFGRSLSVFPTLKTTRAGRFPTQAVVVTSAARRIIALSKEGEKLQSVLVKGSSADPTAHPDFTEISLNLRELLNKHYSKVKLYLISDHPRFENARARHAVCYYDFPTLRFEAGTATVFSALTGEPKNAFKTRIEELKHQEGDKLVIVCNLVRGDIDNSTDKEIKEWIKHLAVIRPTAIQLSTKGNKEQGTKAITKGRMTQIIEKVSEATGITPEVVEA